MTEFLELVSVVPHFCLEKKLNTLPLNQNPMHSSVLWSTEYYILFHFDCFSYFAILLPFTCNINSLTKNKVRSSINSVLMPPAISPVVGPKLIV